MPIWHLSARSVMMGPQVTLCTDPADFARFVRSLHIEHPGAWLGDEGAHGMTHIYHPVGRFGVRCVVCVDPSVRRTPIELVGLLVHEAVHCWQQWCKAIGERAPGDELEAYGVQVIAQDMIAAMEQDRHARRLERHRKKRKRGRRRNR